MSRSKCFGPLPGDFPVLLPVLLVADHNDDDLRLGLCHNLVDPIAQILERLQPRDVVGEHDAVRTPVEDLGNAFETFLPGCVPDLHFQSFLFYFDHQSTEFYSDRNFVVLFEVIRRYAMHQA